MVKAEFLVADGLGSVTQNAPVSLIISGTSADGISAGQPAALYPFLGVSDQTTAINAYGLATISGYKSSCLIGALASSITVTAGDALTPLAGTYLGMTSASVALGAAVSGVAICLEGANVSAASYIKVLVRALR